MLEQFPRRAVVQGSKDMFGRAARKVPDVLSRLTGRVSVIRRPEKIAGSLIANCILKSSRIVELVYSAEQLSSVDFFWERFVCTTRQFRSQTLSG